MVNPLKALRRFSESRAAYEAAQEEVQQSAPELFEHARRELGLNQQQLADALGIDRTYLSKIENGHMKPGRAVLERLTELLSQK